MEKSDRDGTGRHGSEWDRGNGEKQNEVKEARRRDGTKWAKAWWSMAE